MAMKAAGIDQPVQALPVAPQALLPAVGRGDREHHQRQQRHEADGEVEALDDLGRDHDQVPFLVEHVDQEVRAGIERRRDADAPADLHQRHPVEQRARRRHGERQHEEDDGPVAGRMRGHRHRPRLEVAVVPAPGKLQRRQAEPDQRHEAQPEDLLLGGHAATLRDGSVNDSSNLCHPLMSSPVIRGRIRRGSRTMISRRMRS